MEEEFEASGGEWREVKVGKLFHIRPTKNYGLTNQKLFANYGSVPVVVNSSQNNGIGGFVDLEPTERGNMITFSDTTTSDSIFYQPNDFIGYSHVQGMFPYEEWNKYSLLYFVICFRTATKGKFDYGNKFNRDKAKEILVTIPYHNNKIAFKYMENYIKALEAERIETLEAYLTVTNLRDYHLTKNDEKVLDKFAKLSDTKSRVEESEDYAYFKLQDVLKWCSGIKELNPLKLDELSDESENKYPFYGQAIINNGIISYHNLRREVLNNPDGRPTILIHSNNQNIVYLESPFYLKDGHGATSVLQSEKLDKYTAFYLMTAIKKVIDKRFNYNAKATKIGLKETEIQLPIQNGQIDYTFMSDFIRAVEKLVIKDLVIWADKKIAATKEVVAR